MVKSKPVNGRTFIYAPVRNLLDKLQKVEKTSLMC
jgi:hypothetical protein